MIIVAILSSLVSGMVGFLAGCGTSDSVRADEMAAQQIDELERIVAIHTSPNVVSLDYYRAHHPHRAAS